MSLCIFTCRSTSLDRLPAANARVPHLGPRPSRLGRRAGQRRRAIDSDAAGLARRRRDDERRRPRARSHLASEIAAERFEAVYLLGMGGSSLCAEVLRLVSASRNGTSRALRPRHDRRADDHDRGGPARSRRDAVPRRQQERRHGRSRVDGALLLGAHGRASEGSAAGRHFIAITDPGTALQALAESKRYREVFLNPADIGGRFSALSLFGLVRARSSAPLRRSCWRPAKRWRTDAGRRITRTPGSSSARSSARPRSRGATSSRSRLPPSLASLGLWIEQLVAESTGKHGKGALPVVDEPLGRPDEYGSDRAFVAIATDATRRTKLGSRRSRRPAIRCCV